MESEVLIVLLSFFISLQLYLIQTIRNLERRLACLEGKIEIIAKYLNEKR